MNLCKNIQKFKLLSTLFCVIGFTYHTTELFSQYWQGKTIVNINLVRLDNDTLPAITIGYPFALSFRKMAKLDHAYNVSFQQYKNSVLNSSFNHANSDELVQLYRGVVSDVLNKIKNKSLDFEDILRDFTIDFRDEPNEDLIKLAINVLHPGTFTQGKVDTSGNYSPIESIDMVAFDERRVWEAGKSFTFFSGLQNEWRYLEKSLNRLHILIKYDSLSFPINNETRIVVSLHSPNTFPEWNLQNFKVVEPAHLYSLTYSQISTELLDSNYDTNCIEYDLDNKFGNLNMRSDCLLWCYQDQLNKYYKSNSIFETGAIFRTSMFGYFRDKYLDTSFKGDMNILHQAKSACKIKCPSSCKFKYYDMLLEEYPSNFSHTRIQIVHNNMPDIHIKYLPEMTFISLVCNLGGLLGMWLGLSILVIFQDGYKFANAFIRLRKNKINHQVYNLSMMFRINNFYTNPRTRARTIKIHSNSTP